MSVFISIVIKVFVRIIKFENSYPQNEIWLDTNQLSTIIKTVFTLWLVKIWF